MKNSGSNCWPTHRYYSIIIIIIIIAIIIIIIIVVIIIIIIICSSSSKNFFHSVFGATLILSHSLEIKRKNKDNMNFFPPSLFKIKLPSWYMYKISLVFLFHEANCTSVSEIIIFNLLFHCTHCITRNS